MNKITEQAATVVKAFMKRPGTTEKQSTVNLYLILIFKMNDLTFYTVSNHISEKYMYIILALNMLHVSLLYNSSFVIIFTQF